MWCPGHAPSAATALRLAPSSVVGGALQGNPQRLVEQRKAQNKYTQPGPTLGVTDTGQSRERYGPWAAHCREVGVGNTKSLELNTQVIETPSVVPDPFKMMNWGQVLPWYSEPTERLTE